MTKVAGRSYAPVLSGLALFAAAVCAGGAQPEGQAWLKTKVRPGRAGVFVDGKYAGPAANFRIARKYPLTPGKHEVRLVEPRYEDFATTVDVAPGKTTTLSQALKPLPPAKGPFGMVRTKSPDKFAAVYVNGRFFGHADEFSNSAQGILLPPGEYLVRLEPVSGGGVSSRKVQVEVGRVVVVE